MRKGIVHICLLGLFLIPFSVHAADTTAVAKPSIYQGTTVKLDIGSAALAIATSKGRLQHYELDVNVRLKDRFYPTLELGYAGGRTERGDSLSYNAHGGFVRVGCDINPLKKSAATSPHAMLVGLRVGTGVQAKKTDCWGEIVWGCQVEIAKVQNTAFYMGLMGRLKILFTRQDAATPAAEAWPIYIPGFGHRGDTAWGLSYHLGWRF
jgi:hypothetical protein